MKVGEAVKFDTKKLKMVGFTDLGEHTSLHQQSKKGDCHYVSAIPGKMGSGSSMLFVKRMCYWNCFAPFDYRMYNTFGKIWVFC